MKFKLIIFTVLLGLGMHLMPKSVFHSCEEGHHVTDHNELTYHADECGICHWDIGVMPHLVRVETYYLSHFWPALCEVVPVDWDAVLQLFTALRAPPLN